MDLQLIHTITFSSSENWFLNMSDLIAKKKGNGKDPKITAVPDPQTAKVSESTQEPGNA